MPASGRYGAEHDIDDHGRGDRDPKRGTEARAPGAVMAGDRPDKGTGERDQSHEPENGVAFPVPSIGRKGGRDHGKECGEAENEFTCARLMASEACGRSGLMSQWGCVQAADTLAALWCWLELS